MSNNKKAPAIRFKGFNDDWEQRKLGEVAKYRNGKAHENNISEYGKYIVVNSKFVSTNGEVKKYSNNQIEPLYKNEIAFVLSDVPNGRAIARTFIIDEDDKYTLNQRIAGITAEDITSPYFLYILMNRNKYFLKFDDGVKQTNLSLKDVLEFKESYPNYEEQTQIGKFFSNLDHLITLQKRKCDKLILLKKAMLEQLFPKGKKSIPEIRFKDFNDDWEERKFSDAAIIRRGLTYKPCNISENGVRVLRSSNINEDTFVFGEDDVFVEESAVNIPYIQNDDILITSANGSSRLVGKHAIIRSLPEGSTVHGGFMLVASSSNPEFLNASMSSQWYSEFISLYVAGGNGAIGNLNKNDLDMQVILIPSESEQTQIGTFFRTLDNLIALQKRKLEKLKIIKKSMLDKMFI